MSTDIFESESDDKIIQELQSQNIEGLTPRGRLAISTMAETGENSDGAAIFLILSLNSRIRELEEQIGKLSVENECKHRHH